jgi:hypothetical protein
VEVYAAVRRFVFVEGQSRREAARVFGLSRDTIGKMCRFSVPPCSQQATGEAQLGSADTLIPVIEAILEADQAAERRARRSPRLGWGCLLLRSGS